MKKIEIDQLNKISYYKFDIKSIQEKLKIKTNKELIDSNLIFDFDECCDGFDFDKFFYILVNLEIRKRKIIK
jgi:hypothetical protein